MMMDSISEARLNDVCPWLADRIRQLADIVDLLGVSFRVTQGDRTWAQQQELYDQVPRVTKAPPGYSWHNFGLAVDVSPDDPALPGYQPDWNLAHPAWKLLAAKAGSVGLFSGSEFRTFPDWPHFQPVGIPLTPTDEDRQLFQDGGCQAVWEKCGLA